MNTMYSLLQVGVPRYMALSIILLLSGNLNDTQVYAGLPSENGSTDSGNRSTEASDAQTLRHTEWIDMVPHTKDGSYYNEFWVYHVFLENDLHLHITFSLANFGSFKSAVSGGKLFVSNFKGNNYHVLREFPREQFIVDEETHMIRLHSGREIYLQGKLPESHKILYQTTKNEVSYLVDLTFEDIHPGYTVGDGTFRLSGEEMGIYIHIPKASVRGTVAINDDTLEVSGTAYMDHTYQTDLSSKIIDKGFRHISHTENGFHTGYYLIPDNRSDTGVAGLGLLQNGSDETQLKQPRNISILESHSVNGKSVPGRIAIDYETGERRTLERTNDFQHVSFLSEVGGLRKRLVRTFLGGEIIEYVGQGRMDDATPVNYNFLIVH